MTTPRMLAALTEVRTGDSLRREVRYTIDHLPLLPGRYVVSVSAYDYHLVEPFDHRERVATFTVTEGGTLERFGKVTLGGTWQLTPAGTPEPVGS